MCDQPSVTSVPSSRVDGPEFLSQMIATTFMYDMHCMGMRFCAALPRYSSSFWGWGVLLKKRLGGHQFHSDEAVETAIHEWS